MKRPTNTDKSKSRYSGIVPAVEEASRILITLAQNNPGKMTLTQIRWEVGIHNCKAYSILNTLQKFGFVHKDSVSKRYSLGMGLIFLSQRALDGSLDFRGAASPFLCSLSSRTDSTAILGLISGNHFYVAAKDERRQAMAVTFRIGQRFPLFWGTHGKAILAFMPEEERKGILASGRLSFHGDGSAPDLVNLEKELIYCKISGYTADLDATKGGIRSVASPVFGPAAKLIGAFVVIGTFPGELVAEYGGHVAREAQIFSALLEGRSNATERI